MTDMLNLDELATAIRQVKLKGRDRTLRSMTVQEFIDSKAFTEKLQATKGVEAVDMMVAQLVDYLADTTIEELKALTMEQLAALLSFVRGDAAAKTAATAADAAVDAAGNEATKAS